MILRHLLTMAARRAAADPRVRAKAAEFYETQAKPVIGRKLQSARQAAAEGQPGEHPARLAGRVIGRLLKD